jgi:sugar phosphate isomerase/epimerase
MNLMLGATTRPWNTFSLEQACQSIAAAGYPEVAVFSNAGVLPVTSQTSPEAAAAVQATARAAGVEATMLLASVRLELPLEEAVVDYRRLIDGCAALGAPWLMDCGTDNPATYEAYREIMRQCAPYAESRGVALTMKPHGGIGLTGKLMVATVEAVGHPNFSLCYDPGNIIYYTKGDLRPETDVADVLGHVSICIIKDCLVREGQPDVWILPGEGWVDFRVVLEQLVEGGFRGPLYVECLGGTELADIDDRACRTHELIGGIVAGL